MFHELIRFQELATLAKGINFTNGQVNDPNDHSTSMIYWSMSLLNMAI